MSILKTTSLIILFSGISVFLLFFNQPAEEISDKEPEFIINVLHRDISLHNYNPYECGSFGGLGRTVIFSYENGSLNKTNECSKYLIDPELDAEDIEKLIVNKTQIHYLVIINNKSRILWEGEISEFLAVNYWVISTGEIINTTFIPS